MNVWNPRALVRGKVPLCHCLSNCTNTASSNTNAASIIEMDSLLDPPEPLPLGETTSVTRAVASADVETTASPSWEKVMAVTKIVCARFTRRRGVNLRVAKIFTSPAQP